MKLKCKKHRSYLIGKKNKTIKMIPQKYLLVAEDLILEDPTKIRLTLIERIQLEELLLRSPSTCVGHFLLGKKFKGVRKVSVKFGEDRFEALFDIIRIICTKQFYDLASIIPKYRLKNINSQS